MKSIFEYLKTKGLQHYKEIEEPKIGNFGYDWNDDKWKIEDWSYFKDKTRLKSLLKYYDVYGTMQEDIDTFGEYKDDDIIVGASSKDERCAFYWGPGGLYIK